MGHWRSLWNMGPDWNSARRVRSVWRSCVMRGSSMRYVRPYRHSATRSYPWVAPMTAEAMKTEPWSGDRNRTGEKK